MRGALYFGTALMYIIFVWLINFTPEKEAGLVFMVMTTLFFLASILYHKLDKIEKLLKRKRHEDENE